MGLAESEALVLRTYNLAEADKIVVCLTRNAGLIRAVAKGSRRLKNRFGASLEPFTLVSAAYYQKENQELASLRSAEILTSRFDLSADPQVLSALAYMADLLIEFSPPHQPNDKLFRMVNACLDALALSPSQLQLVVKYFEVWLLRLEGFLPDLNSCTECGEALQEKGIAVLDNAMELRCQKCGRGRGEVLSQRTYLMLRATQYRSPSNFANEHEHSPTTTIENLGEFTHRLISRALDRRPRVQSVIQPLRS